MARFQLLPAETRFFDWFEKGGANLLQATRLLQDLIEHYHEPEAKMTHITATERAGDTIVHEIHDLLHTTLITPIDPEETQALSQAIDNVVDTIEQVGILMLLYKVEKPTPEAGQLAALLVSCAEQIVLALPMLRDKKTLGRVQDYIVEVHRLENEADAVGRKALENLVATSRNDWFEFMRWKEIYDLLEEATDLCEDIGDVLQTVVMKNA